MVQRTEDGEMGALRGAVSDPRSLPPSVLTAWVSLPHGPPPRRFRWHRLGYSECKEDRSSTGTHSPSAMILGASPGGALVGCEQPPPAFAHHRYLGCADSDVRAAQWQWLLHDPEKQNAWKPRFSRRRQRKQWQPPRCPWPQPGLRSPSVAVTTGPFLFLPAPLSALRAGFDRGWPAWLYTSPPVGESPPELSDVWEVSNTDAFSLRRLCLTDAGEISRFTKTGPCGIFWTLNALFVSSYEATVLPLGFSAVQLPFYTLRKQQMPELMWTFWAWAS